MSEPSGDLDQLAPRLRGSFFASASVGGVTRVQGTLSCHRQVFHADVDGVTVAADRADTLAWLLDAAIDERRLAVSLLDPAALHPLIGQPVWQDVAVVPMGHHLQLDRDGGRRVIRHWRPPDPVLPMAEGAAIFGAELSKAVEVRVDRHPLVTADLGGLDSTSVCCLAHRHATKVVAYTIENDDPGDDEVGWARRTVAGLGDVEHHIIPGADIPGTYDGLAGLNVPLDEPCVATVDLARFLFLPQMAANRGSRLHLTGFGGDELLSGSPAHLHRLLRTQPGVALKLLRGFAVKERWSYRDALGQLADHAPYVSWLRQVADELTSPAPTGRPALGWGTPPRLPAWVTPAAADSVRELIMAELPHLEPLAPDRGFHVELDTLRAVSRIVAQLAQIAAGLRITVAAPFHDDAVIEAGLAVRAQERVTPWHYKPLILEAMRDVIPESSLLRQTKSDGSCSEDGGLRKNRADLLALCDGSRLGRLGLIDEEGFREACRRPAPLPEQIGLLYQTVACEVWLRASEATAVAASGEK